MRTGHVSGIRKVLGQFFLQRLTPRKGVISIDTSATLSKVYYYHLIVLHYFPSFTLLSLYLFRYITYFPSVSD